MRERLIVPTNPQPEIRRNAENTDWEYRSEAAYLYEKAVQLRERLIDPIARIDRGVLPDPIIGFNNLRNYKVLAQYSLTKDPVGLSLRIDFNTEHYVDGQWRWGRWAQLETLVHEYVHLWEQQVGNGKPGHGKQFVDKMESMGLHPLPGVGCHIAVADEPFAIVMRELGLERPDNVPTDDRRIDWFKTGKEVKGRSSLYKWCCPNCGANVRVGIKDDPMLVHKTCSEQTGTEVLFVRG